MAEIGKYIYGIVNSNPAFRLFIPKDVLEKEKNGTDSVYPIPYEDISAVVSDSEIVDFTHLRKDALALKLVNHQKIIERIMSLEYTIIPMRLGTFALNEIEVRDILSRGYGLVKEIFQKINDKIEIDVVVMWSDFNATIKKVGEEKEIKEFKEKLLSIPKGITVDDQMKVGFMVKKALEGRREGYAFQIQNILKTVSNAFKVHELMDDKMVINMAFLIDKAKEKEFYAEIENLNNRFAEKLNFRCVGPLPPYSFYTLEIKKMKFEEIDWARKRLGLLNEFISKDEIKKAYQASAFSSHPDKNPDTPGIEKDFDDVVKAYKLLLEYSLSSEQTGQGSLSFNEEEFKKDAILVKVRE